MFIQCIYYLINNDTNHIDINHINLIKNLFKYKIYLILKNEN